jgi:hypothetical protein
MCAAARLEVICIGPADAGKGVVAAGLRFEAYYTRQFPLGSYEERAEDQLS